MMEMIPKNKFPTVKKLGNALANIREPPKKNEMLRRRTPLLLIAVFNQFPVVVSF
jgi:hypothetical protein